MDNDHAVFVFDWQKNDKPIIREKGDSQKILDIICRPDDPLSFCTVGVKHIKFWKMTLAGGKAILGQKKGLFGTKGTIQAVLCGAFMSDGTFVSGCINGEIYIWTNKNEIGNIIQSGHKVGDRHPFSPSFLEWKENKCHKVK